MNKLGETGRAWLKGLHILCTATWVGTAVCTTFLYLAYRPDAGPEAHTLLTTIKSIDDGVLVPSAVSSLLSGLLLVGLSPGGLFSRPWVITKLIGTLVVMLSGILFFSPRMNAMVEIVTADPQRAAENPTFLSNHQFISIAIGPQVLVVLCLALISALPWKWGIPPSATSSSSQRK